MLGLRTSDDHADLWLHHGDGRDTSVHEQPTATRASYTVLDFVVDDVGAAVGDLAARGVHVERYDGTPQDEQGSYAARALTSPGSPTPRATSSR